MLKMHTEANSRVSLHPSSEPGALFNGVYLEVEVNENPDNLSLVVVDFDDGERSSVTFSPDLIPCAAHRPPHQREELKAQVNEKAWSLH